MPKQIHTDAQRTRHPAVGKKNKSAKKNKTTVDDVTVQELDSLIAEYADSADPESTKKTYQRHIKDGRIFLADLVNQRRKVPPNDDVNTDSLEAAFDSQKPNRYSAMALELFITNKCLKENRGLSTAQQIHGAWARHWDRM